MTDGILGGNALVGVLGEPYIYELASWLPGYSLIAMTETSESTPNRRYLGITPWEAFTAAAAIVSALGLAFSLGRQMPIQPVVPRQATATFEAVYNQPPITYQRLEVDRGDAR